MIHTPWNPDRFVRGATNADQTNIALDHCTGEWCFYLQADEVIHENDHQRILDTLACCRSHPEADGLLFSYNHFWGDYSRVHRSHCWYSHDIRVVRVGTGHQKLEERPELQDGRRDKKASRRGFRRHRLPLRMGQAPACDAQETEGTGPSSPQRGMDEKAPRRIRHSLGLRPSLESSPLHRNPSRRNDGSYQEQGLEGRRLRRSGPPTTT
ncbi:MAG: hypothetical protein MZU95_05805 [Desulfomicrobium escambiense]|nr:hypothetical protein [Desulfomicrobium escambiense]